jgi:two-component system, chemotaxis family, chemotaxis protein CheY
VSTSAPIPSRLLAIDDNADSAELIVRLAGKSGYEARSLQDLNGLTETLKQWMPQVITLDLCMPQEDGIEILGRLQDCGFSGALLIVSGQEDWFRQSAVRLAGARGFDIVEQLSKPVDIKSLRSLLSDWRNRQGLSSPAARPATDGAASGAGNGIATGTGP